MWRTPAKQLKQYNETHVQHLREFYQAAVERAKEEAALRARDEEEKKEEGARAHAEAKQEKPRVEEGGERVGGNAHTVAVAAPLPPQSRRSSLAQSKQAVSVQTNVSIVCTALH